MTGKCATCEFFRKLFDGREKGTCHIRSVASDSWPERPQSSGCGEHSPLPLRGDPPDGIPEVHTGERVSKSMLDFAIEEPS